jgi:hypothetical protein
MYSVGPVFRGELPIVRPRAGALMPDRPTHSPRRAAALRVVASASVRTGLMLQRDGTWRRPPGGAADHWSVVGPDRAPDGSDVFSAENRADGGANNAGQAGGSAATKRIGGAGGAGVPAPPRGPGARVNFASGTQCAAARDGNGDTWLQESAC